MPGLGTGAMAGSLYSVYMIHKECFPLQPGRVCHGPHLEQGNQELIALLRDVRIYSVWDAYFRSLPLRITLVCDEWRANGSRDV